MWAQENKTKSNNELQNITGNSNRYKRINSKVIFQPFQCPNRTFHISLNHINMYIQENTTKSKLANIMGNSNGD